MCREHTPFYHAGAYDDKRAKARSIHWSPYDRVRVVNADP